jgi:hypothetical protein
MNNKKKKLIERAKLVKEMAKKFGVPEDIIIERLIDEGLIEG